MSVERICRLIPFRSGRRVPFIPRAWLAEEMNWIAFPRLDGPLRVKAKTRYRQTEQAATVYPEGERRIRLEFDEPQRAVTVGQAVVLYDGDTVVGGGTICETGKEGEKPC